MIQCGRLSQLAVGHFLSQGTHLHLQQIYLDMYFSVYYAVFCVCVAR